jgi:hypothetical protein
VYFRVFTSLFLFRALLGRHMGNQRLPTLLYFTSARCFGERMRTRVSYDAAGAGAAQARRCTAMRSPVVIEEALEHPDR